MSETEQDNRLPVTVLTGLLGSGKTTLAQAIAEYLDEDIGAMVKTMEAPRDLQLAERITQYAPLSLRENHTIERDEKRWNPQHPHICCCNCRTHLLVHLFLRLPSRWFDHR